MFLNSFDYFRAITILLIVAGHCFGLVGWDINSYPEMIVANLILGGSTLFVFISGFLFHHVFYRRFSYRGFMAKKISNVLVPYLFLSVPLAAWYVVYAHTGPHAEVFFLGRHGIFHEYIRPFVMYLWTGRTLLAYWYIPFIMLVFALSPVFVAYIRLGARNRLLIASLLLLVPVFIHRPYAELSVLQSLAYFLPVYLIGILASVHRETLYRKLRGREIYLLAVVLAFSLYQVMVLHTYENFVKPPFVYGGPDTIILQKLALALFLMIFLHRFEDRQWPLPGYIASISFSIYFLHPLVMLALDNTIDFEHLNISGGLLWMVVFPAVLALSIAGTALVKLVSGSHSRRLIGS